MDSLLQDFRVAVRALLATPTFTVAAVITIALAIGANTAIFSIVDGVLLRPAPVQDVERLAVLWQTDRNAGTTREPASVPDFVDFKRQLTQFAALEAFTPADVNLTLTGGEPRRLAALGVTPGFLSTLGVPTLLGRTFNEEEGTSGNNAVAVISERLWQSAFAGDSTIIGRDALLNDIPFKIVGVLRSQADFGIRQVLASAAYGGGFATRPERIEVDVWVPLVVSPDSPRDSHSVLLLGRLAEGATVGSAQQEAERVADDLERQYPSNAARGAHVEAMQTVVFAQSRTPLLLLMGAVALVLLVACSNVVNLMLTRHSARLHEVSVRVALGASQRRVVQQFLVEALVLSVLGALLGLLMADGALRILLAVAPANLPRIGAVTIDSRVVLLTTAVTVGMALLFGLLPSLQARRSSLAPALHGSTRSSSGSLRQQRLRSALVVAQLAMAVALMTSAGLVVRSLWQLQQVSPGYTASGVLKAEYQLPAGRYPRDFAVFPNWVAQSRFNTELLRRVEQVPGVTSAAITVWHPVESGFTSSITVVGREQEAATWAEPSIRIVSPGYFETMRVPLVSGRLLAEGDAGDATPVAVINEAARARYFGAQDPHGQLINLWGAQRRVVGVIGDERLHGLTNDAPSSVYLPVAQVPSRFGTHTVLLRATGDLSNLATTVRNIIAELDPALPVYGIEPLEETLSSTLSARRFTMYTMGGFALLALVLAAVGVHGVLSYAVTLRTKEIGIRVALGAAPSQVERGVLREGARLAAIGLILGIGGALALGQAISSQLFGIPRYDPVTLATVTVLLGATALVACLLPARRAARVDPLVALRAE